MAQSRISRLEENRTKKQLYLSILGVVGLLIFIITVGIPLVVGGSVFVGNIKSKDPLKEAGDMIAPLQPTLSGLPSSTNTKTILVEGFGEPQSTLKLFVNGEEVKDTLLGNDGTFQFSDINLDEGENSIYATCTDQAENESAPSKEQKIRYLKNAPKVEIESPQENQSFSRREQEIDVKGKTDIGVNISINERFVRVNDDGTFTFRLKLNDGENTITIVAQDQAGNETKIERKVTYSPS